MNKKKKINSFAEMFRLHQDHHDANAAAAAATAGSGAGGQMKSSLRPPLQCSSCLNDLARGSFISALGQDWHIECFRCSVCDGLLSNWYFEKDGLLFCRDDYWQRFGDACQQCSASITGPAMIAGDHKFHPECFCCSMCHQYIGDGDCYALVERSKLFW